jgi:citrate lyase subunit gamma (acyl carrier protein)
MSVDLIPTEQSLMNVRRKATAGTMQSSDLTVSIEPADRLEIRIESAVKKQFEHLIRARIEEVLSRHGVQHALVQVADRGALDYAIEARVETALRRAAEE